MRCEAVRQCIQYLRYNRRHSLHSLRWGERFLCVCVCHCCDMFVLGIMNGLTESGATKVRGTDSGTDYDRDLYDMRHSDWIYDGLFHFMGSFWSTHKSTNRTKIGGKNSHSCTNNWMLHKIVEIFSWYWNFTFNVLINWFSFFLPQISVFSQYKDFTVGSRSPSALSY